MFGVIEEKIKHGLFGTSLTWILEVLPYLKSQNIFPLWNIDTYCYGPLIPHILVPKKRNTLTTTRIPLTQLKKMHQYHYTSADFQMAHDLFHEYFHVADDILQIVARKQAEFGKTLGIHYRGTDKFTESQFISMATVIANVTEFLKTHEFDTLFVISDGEKFIQEIMKSFPGYRLVFTESQKTQTNIPMHLQHENNSCLAKEAMIDSLLLSKCDYVIKTSSTLSDWVKIWNPSIEVYNLNNYHFPYFPQANIPVKSFLSGL